MSQGAAKPSPLGDLLAGRRRAGPIDELAQPLNAARGVDLGPLRWREADGALYQAFIGWLGRAALWLVCVHGRKCSAFTVMQKRLAIAALL